MRAARVQGQGVTPWLAALGLALICHAPALAQMGIALPRGAVQTISESREGIYRLPVAGYTPQAQPHEAVEGRIVSRAWRLPEEASDPFATLRVLREELVSMGYEVLFQCETEGCGGFDFRFGIEVLPPPEMEVDLGTFHFLSARKPGDPVQHVAVLTSRTALNGYVQMTEILPLDAPDLPVGPPRGTPDVPLAGAEPVAALPASAWSEALQTVGHAVVEGLVFASGSSALAEESAPALEGLAAFLNAAPDLRVHIVGHSDAVGGLAGNLNLSRARAEAVRRALIDRHGIEAGRLAASGVAYLAPRASNATAEGRALNRRVEIVLEE